MVEWISVHDRLPGKSGMVIVLDELRLVQVAQYSAICNQFNYPGVTHWMPIPELPKEDEHGLV